MANNIINIALGEAVKEGNLKRVRILLAAGGDANFEPTCKSHPNHKLRNVLLHFANSAEIAKELLLHGAWVDSKNCYKETPLHTAISCKRPAELLRELLKKGSNIFEIDRHGNTPLHLAVNECNYKAIRELLDYGADKSILNHRDFNKKPPSDHVIEWDVYYNCAKVLIKYSIINYLYTDYKVIVNILPNVTSGPYNELSHYFHDCDREIMRMKTDIIVHNISLYELISETQENRTHMLYHDVTQSIRNFFQVLLSKSYPIYHDVILVKISACLRRKCLLHKLSDLVVKTKLVASNQIMNAPEKTAVLDSYLIEKFSQYLSNKDFVNYTLAFCQHTDQLSCSKENSIAEPAPQPNIDLLNETINECLKCFRLD